MRIVHRIIATNVVLKQMNEVQNELCDFCVLERESIEHLFWRCYITKTFWNTLQQHIIEKCAIASRLKFTENLILFGLDTCVVTDDTFDEIVVVAKMFIYKCKYEKSLPCLMNFRQYLTTHYKIQWFNARISLGYDKFTQNWMFYKNILDDH